MSQRSRDFSATVSHDTVTVARTTEEVEALRPLWRTMTISNVDADIDYFLTVVAHQPDTIEPHVVCIRRPGRTPLLIVARLESHPFPLKAGYREIISPRLRSIVVSFDGMLGATSEDDVATCLAALRVSLSTGVADAIIFQKLALDSVAHSAVVSRCGPGSRIRGLPPTTRWLVDLPDTMSDFMSRRSPGAQRKARTDNRKLRRSYNDRVAVVRLDQGGLDNLLMDLEEVSSKTYQRALGVGGTTTEVGQALTPLCLDKGWLRVWMLYLEDKPVAFWWGNLHSGVLTIDSPGFDPEHARDGVGIHVMYAMFEELCEDPLADTVDFGHGDAEYKSRYSTRSQVEEDIVVLAQRTRPLLMGAYVSAALLVRKLAYRALRKSQAANRLRRSWRSRLRVKSTITTPSG